MLWNNNRSTKQISSQLPALWLGILLLCAFTPVATSTKYDLPLPVLPAQCPDNFILLPNSNHCYGFQVGAPKDNVQTWKEADSSCKRDGGTLCHVPLEPSDATIFVFLRQKATQMKVESAWVARPPMIAQMSGRGNVSMTGNDHICTYVDFPVGSPQMYLNTEGCNQEKRSFICDIKITPMPVRLKRPTGHSRHRNDQDNFNRYERRRKGYGSIRRRHQLDAQVAASEKEGPPRAVNKQDTGRLKEHVKPPSSKQVNQIMPPNLSGLAKLDPVRPTELLKARDNLLILMYGSPAVSPEMLEQGFLPGELDTANISKTSLETAKLLLLEIASEGMKPRQKRNATETAKALTITLLEEGRPLQCYYGVNQQRRIISCMGSNSKIETCAKAVTRSGKVVRSCGLPGYTNNGCHNTIDGTVCYCGSGKNGNIPCNAGSKSRIFLHLLLPVLLIPFLV